MIGQRDEHSLEHAHLLRCRSLLRGKPEGQLAEPDVTNQFAGKIVTKQMNTRDIRRPDAGGIFHLFLICYKVFSPLDTGPLPVYPG